MFYEASYVPVRRLLCRVQAAFSWQHRFYAFRVSTPRAIYLWHIFYHLAWCSASQFIPV